MIHHPWAMLLGAASLVVVLLNLLTNKPLNRHPDAVGMAGAMLAVWFITMWSNALFEPPDSKIINSFIDAGLAAWLALTWATRREAWKLWVLGLLGIQSLAHVEYQTFSTFPGVLNQYGRVLDYTFGAQLVAIGWPGGTCVARLLRDYMRAHRHPHHHVGAR